MLTFPAVGQARQKMKRTTFYIPRWEDFTWNPDTCTPFYDPRSTAQWMMQHHKDAAAAANREGHASTRGVRLGFLDLPGELRNEIYKRVLVSDCMVELGTFDEEDGLWKACQPAVLHTCRQIRKEALELFYVHNTFHTTFDLSTPSLNTPKLVGSIRAAGKTPSALRRAFRADKEEQQGLVVTVVLNERVNFWSFVKFARLFYDGVLPPDIHIDLDKKNVGYMNIIFRFRQVFDESYSSAIVWLMVGLRNIGTRTKICYASITQDRFANQVYDWLCQNREGETDYQVRSAKAIASILLGPMFQRNGSAGVMLVSRKRKAASS